MFFMKIIKKIISNQETEIKARIYAMQLAAMPFLIKKHNEMKDGEIKIISATCSVRKENNILFLHQNNDGKSGISVTTYSPILSLQKAECWRMEEMTTEDAGGFDEILKFWRDILININQ